MAEFPSNTAVDTVDRLRAERDLSRRFLSPNLLINPGFTRITREFGLPGVPTLDFILQYPGWFSYGLMYAGTGSVGGMGTETPASFPATTHPMNQPEWPDMLLSPGELGGLTQQIPNAHLLRGRRVRISGIYGTKNAPAERDPLGGISIWLKGGKQSASSTAAVDWVAGGIGYTHVKFPTATGVMHAVELLPGNATPYGTEHDRLNRWCDRIQDDGVDYSIQFMGDGLQGVNGRDELTLWYLDDQFSGTPAADGSFKLYSEIHDVDNDTKYFEAYIDVPDDPDLFEDDECWLVVFGVDPSDVGSTVNTHHTRLYALTLEVVLDSASIEDRVLHGNLVHQMNQAPWGGGALTPRQLYRYPIFAPGVVPLTVSNILPGALSSADPAAGTNDSTIRRIVFRPVGKGTEFTVYIDATKGDPGRYIAKQETLPPGSVINKAGMILSHEDGAGGYVDPRIFHTVSYVTFDGGAINGFWEERTFEIVNLKPGTTGGGSPGSPNFGFFEAEARRNRVGVFWQDSQVAPTYADVPAIDGKFGTSEIFFVIDTDAADDEIQLGTGYIMFVYDPRIQFVNGFNLSGSP